MCPRNPLASGFLGTFDPKPTDSSQFVAMTGAWGPLAIIDDTGPLGLAWFGELHNEPELRRELGLATETPFGHLLHVAWQRWSIDLLTRLDGVFAFAALKDDNLLLYRDPSGLRNLYFSAGQHGAVAFSTDLSALPRLPGVERRLVRRSLHEYLRFGDIAAPETLFEDVSAVAAGQLVRCSVARIEKTTLPARSAISAIPHRFSEAVDMLDAHLQHGVLARLAGAGRPAAFLSGGIDSALLCAIASRSRPDITAITVGFNSAAHDETPIAQRVASHLRLSHEAWRFDRADYLAGFDRLSQLSEQPIADPAAVATVLALERCHGRFDVVIDGTGADESVGLMPPRHVRIAVAYASLLPIGARQRLARMARRSRRLSGYLPIVDFEHPADTMIRWQGFTRGEIEILCGEPVSFSHTQFYRTFETFPRTAHFERYSALMEVMPCDRLSQAMLITNATVRFPFWAQDADRFVRQLCTEHRYLNGEPKRILRAVLARYVPRQLWDVPKHGFNFPFGEFLRGDDHSLVRRHLDRERWHSSGLLSADKVHGYAQQFMSGDDRLTFRIWTLVVLDAWLQHHPNALPSAS